MQNPEPRRRILICATGMSPQVVTETLYALAVKPRDGQMPWIPDEVHLISTRRGAEHARLNLLSAKPGWFHQLCKDYALEGIQFEPQHIHCITDADGQPLDDIRRPADNEAAANAIAELVRRFSAQDHTQLHVSMAGGRKTMGYYLGYALSLYGRPQDRLSHVLVSEPFESHPDFYYPTPYELVIHTRDPRMPQAVDCRSASVDLAEIPFVRLRDGLPQRLLTGQASFTDTVQVANLALETPLVQIDVRRRSVQVNGMPVRLGDPGFVLYLWLARRALSDEPEVDWLLPENWRDEFLVLLGDVLGRMSTTYEKVQARLEEHFKKKHNETAHYFSPLTSRVNDELTKQLGEPLARRVRIERVGTRATGSRYHLPEGVKIQISH